MNVGLLGMEGVVLIILFNFYSLIFRRFVFLLFLFFERELRYRIVKEFFWGYIVWGLGYSRGGWYFF